MQNKYLMAFGGKCWTRGVTAWKWDGGEVAGGLVVRVWSIFFIALQGPRTFLDSKRSSWTQQRSLFTRAFVRGEKRGVSRQVIISYGKGSAISDKIRAEFFILDAHGL
jgi:hypothetical protein